MPQMQMYTQRRRAAAEPAGAVRAPESGLPPEVLAANGLTDRILRLSVGIENINDLRTDLEQAFAAVQAAL